MKLLLVDDNKDITKMLNMYFTKKGHECSNSNDGQNALEILQNQKFNVILLDLSMPEFSGMDMVEELYKQDKLHDLNIVALTASSISIDNEKHLKKRGIKAILKKPIDPDELLAYLLQFN